MSTFSTFIFQKLANKFKWAGAASVETGRAAPCALHWVFPSTAVGNVVVLVLFHQIHMDSRRYTFVLCDSVVWLFGFVFLWSAVVFCSQDVKYSLAESCEVWYLWQSLTEYPSSCVGMYLLLMIQLVYLLACHHSFIFTSVFLSCYSPCKWAARVYFIVFINDPVGLTQYLTRNVLWQITS